MDDDAARRAREIFLDALDLEPADRAAHLARASAGDGAVHARATELLAAHEGSASLFDALEEGGLGPRPAPSALGAGTSIGPYRILRELGSGGFGTVYLAEQTEPVVRRVALKVLRSELRSDSARVRFAAERQALARMEHPGIARVFDADTTPDGLPYFAMEYVPGDSLTVYCERHQLALGQRLALFERVCLAVEHAHQRGVLHRDIKPSNVLVVEVDGQPHVKVIDFGVAKAIDEPLTELALESVAGELMGTPAYMSPEQATGKLDVDTRADVYALGALLYELLAGVPPFDSRALGLGRLLQAIAQDEPPLPSRRQRTGGESTWSGRIPSDLDWIAMRCLEKERGRRYSSASAVAADVRRFLGGRPVEAAPPSAWYRARKLVRRHRWLTLSSAVLLLALGIGTVGIAVGLLHARQERDVAQAILAFLREDLIAAAQPAMQAGRGKDVKLLEVVDAAARRLEEGGAAERFEGKPRVLAAIRSTLAELYAALGETERSEVHMAAALALYEELGLRESRDALRLASFQASTLRGLGRLDDAIELASDTLALQVARYPGSSSDVVQTRVRLAFAVNAAGDPTRAVGLAEQALADLDRVADADLQLRAMVHSALAITYSGDLRFDLAEEHFRRQLEIEQARGSADRTESLTALTNLAASLQAQGRYDEAVESLREAIPPLQSALGEAHPSVLKLRRNLGRALIHLRRLEEAREELELVLEHSEETFGPGHMETAAARAGLAECLVVLGRPDAAEAHFRLAYADAQSSAGPDARSTQARRDDLIDFLFGVGRLDEELFALAQEQLESKRRAAGELHPSTLRSEVNLALFLESAGRVDESEALYRSCLERFEQSLGRTHPETLETRGALVGLLHESGRLEEAEELGRGALLAIEEEPTDDAVAVAKSRARLAFVLVEQGEEAEARVLLEAALEPLRQGLGPADVWPQYVAQVLDELTRDSD